MLRYIHKRHPGTFTCGVAFNPYEPQDHELEKMRRKVDAGAKFVCTQPVIGEDKRVYALRPFGLPIIIDAWMSKKLHLLSECVGYTIPEDTPYDPMANLRQLRAHYPDCGLYLALLGYKTQFHLLKEVWGPAHMDRIHYLRVFMAGLRRKLEAAAAAKRPLRVKYGADPSKRGGIVSLSPYFEEPRRHDSRRPARQDSRPAAPKAPEAPGGWFSRFLKKKKADYQNE